jgi:D-inositol-3-phosphate glycosyltransferase
MVTINTNYDSKGGMNRLFYIDPQSYNNLSLYDKSLLEHVSDCEIHYFHNVKYQLSPISHVQHHACFSYSDLSGVAKIWSYSLSMMKIVIGAYRLRPKVAHVQWFKFFPVDMLFVTLLHLLHCKVVYTAHNVLPHNPKKRDRFVYGWLYRHADAIIVHTNRSKVELMQLFDINGKKIQVIHHGMLPSATNPDEVHQRSETLQATLHTKEKIVFASMGYQNSYKGIDLLSQVWTGNPELFNNDHLMLLIVGKVQDVDVNPLRACRNVHVVDELVSDIDFDAYLSLASVVLLPYRNISQSGVLFTALQRNIPVLVSNAGGLTEPLGIAKVGWCMGAATKDNLEKAILDIIQHPDQLNNVADDVSAFNEVKAKYSWKEIGQQTSRLYSRLSSR